MLHVLAIYIYRLYFEVYIYMYISLGASVHLLYLVTVVYGRMFVKAYEAYL